MNRLIIWTYHRILPAGGSGAVSQAEFSEQLAFLQRRGCTFIDMAGLLELLEQGIPAGRRYAMLTFDDGWADNLLWATPILREFGAKAVMAVNTLLVNPGTRDVLTTETFPVISAKEALGLGVYGRSYDSFLTWDELAILRDSGIWDLQAHGNSHLGCYRQINPVRGFYPAKQHWTMEHALGCAPFTGAPRSEFVSILAAPQTRPTTEFLEQLRRAADDKSRMKICREFVNPLEVIETEEVFQQRIINDMLECRRQLNAHLRIDPCAMFWPWGHHSATGRHAARKCGFKLALTMTKDVVIPGRTPLDALPRIAAPETCRELQKQYRIFTNPCLKMVRDWFSHSDGEK